MDISAIIELAQKLPTGAVDPRAMGKYDHEFEELCGALAEDDYVGLLLEAADCLYYAIKSLYSGLISAGEFDRLIKEVIMVSGYDKETIYAAALAKYSLRARPGHPKDDMAERCAAIAILEGGDDE